MISPASYVARAPWIIIPLLAIACHLAFSHLGLVLTDDGFVLALSQRLLHGELPHRNILFVRPVGSGLLHAPILLLFREHAMLAARFVVWVQYASIAWLWTDVAVRWTAVRFSPLQRACITLIAFAFGVHNFPIMPWYTTDGLFLLALGTWMSVGHHSMTRMIGYAVAGAAILCKQNFLPAALALPFLTGTPTSWRTWLSLALPSILYAGWIALGGGLADFWSQLTAQTGIVEYGILTFLKRGVVPAGIVIGALGSALLQRHGAARLAGHALLLAVPVGVAATLGMIVGFSYLGLFGVVAGCGLWRLLRDPRGETTAFVVVTLVIAWCAAISIGYNTPALAGGMLWIALAIVVIPMMPHRVSLALLGFLTLLSAIQFTLAREERLPFERPSRELTHDLGTILPAGSGIRTNERTAALLGDAVAAMALAGPHPTTFVPGLPVLWIGRTERNALPTDWPFRTEIPTPELQQRVIDALRAHDDTVVILSRVNQSVADGVSPIDIESDPTFHPIARYALEHGTLIAETPSFGLYTLAP